MMIVRWVIAVGIAGSLLIGGSLLFEGGPRLAYLAYAEEAPVASVAEAPELPSDADAARLFDAEIAPMIARHCLECHDSANREGRLDLSRKDRALAGGFDGPAIVPGDAEQSLAWEYANYDEMPPDGRPTLSPEEKASLRAWIDAGAIWSSDTIDPSALTRDRRAIEQWVQRLTVPEYIETVRSAVGVDVAADARRILPADLRADGFTNTAYNLNVDLRNVEAYAELAEVIVGRMDAVDFAAEHAGEAAAEHAECEAVDDGCVTALRDVTADVGKWLLRGPLAQHEVSAFMAVAEAVAEEGGDCEEALSYIVEAMLQSPRFIYRIERQRGDGSVRRVGDHELASRLSYILWGGPPDRELMRAADAGELSDRGNVEAHVRRMLQDPRAVERSSQFIHEWLNLSQLANLRPNASRFPHWNSQLAADMRDETLGFFHDVVWDQRRPIWELMNAQVTYVTPRLADHYGLERDYSASVADARNREMPGPPERVTDGLQALYTFEEGEGETVHDRSGADPPIDLRSEADPITGSPTMLWTDHGLEVEASEAVRDRQWGTVISAASPPARLIAALRESNAITIEAWVTPANSTQDGPARIITFSRDTGGRNFTLGQNGDRFEVRLRTTDTSDNGQPALSSAEATAGTEPVHIAYTREPSGEAVIYIDGAESARTEIGGDFGNWDDGFELAVANELTGDRLWQGTMHLAAVYDRALSATEVRRNRAAGAREGGPDALAGDNGLRAMYHFDEGDGDQIRNASAAGESLDLRIEDPSAVEWGQEGLTLRDSTLIATDGPATELIDAILATGEITIEAWITPENTSQDGPARIVTLSQGTGQRNFTLGQAGDHYDARFRTTTRDANGVPSIATPGGSADTRPTHLVYVRTAQGTGLLYINGEEMDGHFVDGNLSNWDHGFRLALANETTKDRPWRGTYHSVAIYNRALTPDQILSLGGGPARYDLGSVPQRGGLLTQGSVLTVGGDEASMVARGLFILHDVLYSAVGNAPPCVDTTPVPTKPGMSQRSNAEARLSDPNCNSCHSRFEPLAFGLEKFDGIGGYSERDEHGNELRDDGEILFPGAEEPIPYETAAELMDLLAGSDRVKMNMTRKVTQFALGRPLVESDARLLDEIHAEAEEGGGTYESLITAIVMSDLVQKTRTEALAER